MTDHPAVTFLLAAHERAITLTSAATPGPWTVDMEEERIVAAVGVVARLRDWVRRVTQAQIQADAGLIAEHADPLAVLRRVEADRETLAEHPQIRGLTGFARPAWICETCAEADWAGDRRGDPYPCRTLLLLAKGWGWVAEA